MHQASPAAAFFPAFLLFFGTLWFGVFFLIARFGGWQTLARDYATTLRPEGRVCRFSSLGLQGDLLPASYGHCLTVAVGPRGIWLRPQLLFRVFHAPLFLPWTAVTGVKPKKLLFFPLAAVTVAGFDGRLQFWGRVGREIVAESVRQGKAA